jgi:hypothetical protein
MKKLPRPSDTRRVYFLRQEVNPFAPHRYVADWNLKRTIAFTLVLELPEGKPLEYLAEKMFHLTNAPVECLSEEDQAILGQKEAYKGPALSVGDVVAVESGDRLHKRFLCLPSGWEEK